MQQQNSDSIENPEQTSLVDNASFAPHNTQTIQSPGFSGESQYYAQQLIDTLQKRNRFMTLILVLLILISVSAAFGAFKIYIDYQSATQSVSNLQSDESQQKQIIDDLKETLAQLQITHNDLAKSSDVTGQQLDVSSSTLVTTQQMVEALKTNLDLVKAQRQQLEQENKIIRSALDTTAAGKEKTLSLIDKKETEMEQLRDQLVFDQQQNKALKKEVKNRKNAFNALSKRYQGIKGDIFSLEQTIDQSNRQLVDKNKEIKALKAQVVSNTAHLKTLKKENAELKMGTQRSLQPLSLPEKASSKPTKPLKPRSINAIDVPDEIIIDLN